MQRFRHLLLAVLCCYVKAMYWSGMSDLFGWSRSAQPQLDDPAYSIESTNSFHIDYTEDSLRGHDSRLDDSMPGGESETHVSSFFRNFFSGRHHHHHHHHPQSESVEDASAQFATRQTNDGSTIPWTPMNPRHQTESVEKTLTASTCDTIEPNSHFRTSILPSAMDSALLGYDKAAMVKTKYGAVLGNVFDTYRSFLGIPYAVPPVGPNRWRAAIPLKNFIAGEVLDARFFGKHCMQLDTWESSYFRSLILGLKTEESEDCLTLNVFTPTKARLAKLGKGTKLPVMVFVHGGMYTTGGTSAPIYDPSNLVMRNDVVVVTMNYRMSIWGFLAGHELAADSKAVGNYGMTDVIAALQWVKRFISGFGGDIDNITVSGHSAGSNLVNYLLITLAEEEYRNQNLIHRAILFSGAIGTGRVRYLGNADDEVTLQPLFNKLADGVGCGDATDVLACMRRVDPSDLAKVGIKGDWAYHWGPVVDGHYITGPPLDLVESGAFLQVPILVTDCLDDGTIFSVGEPTVTYDDYLELIQKYFGSRVAPDIGDYYGPTPSCDGTPYFQAASLLLRDALITCPLDMFGGLAASRSESPVYHFRFLTPLSVAWLVSALPYVPDYGVFHGTELILFFQGLSKLTIGQAHAVNHVQRRLMSFLKGGLPDDPKYPLENPAQQLEAPMEIDAICRHWARWPLSPEFLEVKMSMLGMGDGYSTVRTSYDETTALFSQKKGPGEQEKEKEMGQPDGL